MRYLAQDIPFPDHHFDLVLSSLMLHHLPAELKRSGFAEVHRVLKSGGRFLAVDFEPPAAPWLRALTRLVFGHGRLQSHLEDLRDMMAEAGFSRIEGGRTRYKVISYLRAIAG